VGTRTRGKESQKRETHYITVKKCLRGRPIVRKTGKIGRKGCTNVTGKGGGHMCRKGGGLKGGTEEKRIPLCKGAYQAKKKGVSSLSVRAKKNRKENFGVVIVFPKGS